MGEAPADAAASDELDAVIEQFRQAQEALVKGDPEPVKPLHSRHDDVTLANPLGSVRRGWTEIVHRHADPITAARAAESVIQN